MLRALALLPAIPLALAQTAFAAETPAPPSVHIGSVAVELDREVLRPSGSRVGIGARRAAELQKALEGSLRSALEQALSAEGIALASDPATAGASLRVRASRVRLHPVADDLSTPLSSYGRSEAAASLLVEVFADDGRLLLRLAEDFAAPDPGELRPQSALQSRKALESLFARFARETGRRLGGRG